MASVVKDGFERHQDDALPRVDRDLTRQLMGYRVTTAEILYHMPDHPGLLQSFLWQKMDIAPRFPELKRFLDFWAREIDAVLHSIRVAQAGQIKPVTFRHAATSLDLH